MNRALKLAWGLISSPNSFWVQVIVSKYGVDIHNPPLMLPTRYGSHLWKSLGNVWSEVLASRRWCLGDGQSVWFWWDLWVTRDVPLAAYTINNLPSNILNGKVADFVKEDGSGTGIVLNSFFLLTSFFRLLHSIPRPLIRAQILCFGLTPNLGVSLLIRLTWHFQMIPPCMMTGFGVRFGVGRVPKVCGSSYGKCFTID